MARAIRVISVQRGHDPRDYTLMAFGGAGPLHAARLARELDIGRVLVPRNPGILCAMGLLLTDLRADFSADPAADLAGRRAAAMSRTCFRRRWPRGPRRGSPRSTSPPDARRISRTVDMRYAGQNYELPVACRTAPIDAATLDALAEGFAAAHRRLYGFAAEDEPVQLVTFRVEASGLVRKARFSRQPDAGPDASGAMIGRRDVWLPEAGGLVDARSTTATGCAPAIASPVRRSSSRWTRPRSCCPA